MVEAEPASVHQQLRERTIDIGIARMLRQRPEDDMHANVLFDNSHVVVAAANSPWARRQKIRLAELIHEPWVLPPESTFPHSVIEAAFRDAGLEIPRATVTTFSLVVRTSMAASGRFLAMIPRAA